MVRSSFAICVALSVVCGEAQAADTLRKLILTRDYKRAVALLQSQAQAGKADAQYQLGVFYRNGIGVARDEKKAQLWLQKAAANGAKGAPDVLSRLTVQTTTNAVRDGVAPKGEAKPSLPLLSVSHLPAREGVSASWLVEATVRNLPKPVGLSDPINTKDIAGETPLLLATRLNQGEAVRSLLSQGADASIADMRGWTPVMWAARNGNAELAGVLYAAGAKPGARNLAGLGPIGVAAQACKMDIIPTLIKGGESEDASLAVAGRCAGWMSLFPAGTGVLQASLSKGTSEDVRLALGLDSGAVNKEDKNGYVPLLVAAARGDADLVSALLNNNAKAGAVATDGNTALMLAAARGCLDCVRRLLPYTDDINQKNVDGESALYLAVRSRAVDVVKELRDAGASEASRTIGRDTPEKLATRLGDKALLNAVMN